MKSLFDAADSSDVVLWRLFTELLLHLEDSTGLHYDVWSRVDTVLYSQNPLSDIALFVPETAKLKLETPLFNIFEGFESPLVQLRGELDDSVLNQTCLDFHLHSRILDTFFRMWSTFEENPNEFEGLCLALDTDD